MCSLIGSAYSIYIRRDDLEVMNLHRKLSRVSGLTYGKADQTRFSLCASRPRPRLLRMSRTRIFPEPLAGEFAHASARRASAGSSLVGLARKRWMRGQCDPRAAGCPWGQARGASTASSRFVSGRATSTRQPLSSSRCVPTVPPRALMIASPRPRSASQSVGAVTLTPSGTKHGPGSCTQRCTESSDQ